LKTAADEQLQEQCMLRANNEEKTANYDVLNLQRESKKHQTFVDIFVNIVTRFLADRT